MNFRKYQHIERFGTDSVRGIENGTCYVFPKIDGTNASIWLEDGEVKCGSRRRELTIDDDNAGFCAEMINDAKVKEYLKKHPTHRLFGEWLVPHTIRTYREEAWRKFYVFDVCVDNGEDGLTYISYEEYKPLLEEFELNYINPIKIIKNGSYENFIKELESNTFLIKDGAGEGEGIVIKNYEFINKYGKQIWAKIVSSEFKERHYKKMGAPEFVVEAIEDKIVNEFVTIAFIEKEFAKIVHTNGGWETKNIPELLNRTYKELIDEEMWHILKKLKNPTIDFKRLYFLVTQKIKRTKPELFK